SGSSETAQSPGKGETPTSAGSSEMAKSPGKSETPTSAGSSEMAKSPGKSETPTSTGSSEIAKNPADSRAAKSAVSSDITKDSRSTEMVTTESAELAETARLLTVLLDSGRVVVGKAQPAINNPRLEHKGFSSSAFEDQLRTQFLARTGHDLRNLAPAAMPERAKPLLVRLAFFMQKAVQDVQPLINKKGIGFKGFIPATFGTSVATQCSQDTGLKLRQIGPPGVPPRNPDNKPDEQEEQALQAIQKSH